MNYTKGCRSIFHRIGRKELMKHIEGLFDLGMSWENYGKWHIDHIIPIAAFSYTSTHDAEFKKCWSINNLRPLWAKENQSKNSKILAAEVAGMHI